MGGEIGKMGQCARTIIVMLGLQEIKIIVGDFLRKNGVLKTVSAIAKENEVKNPKLLLGLETLLEEMRKRSEEFQSQVSATNSHIASVMKHNDRLIENFNKDLKNMQEKANKIIEHVQINLQHEDPKKKMRDNENLHNQIIELQKKIDDKELAINQMEVMKNTIDENVEAKKKFESIQKDLKEKEKEIEVLKELNQALIVKEKMSIDELEDARKELISGMREVFDPPPAHVAVKKMDELDAKSFTVAAKSWCSSKAKLEDVLRFFSSWEDCMTDPNWHPFKISLCGSMPSKLPSETNLKDHKCNMIGLSHFHN